MRIAAIAHAVPSQRMTNDAVVAIFREVNGGKLDAPEMDKAERRLRWSLRISGTETRYWLGPDERAIDLARDVGAAALQHANLRPTDVDLLIYAGVARGWPEPATAPVVQKVVGCVEATTFDVLDACAS